MRLLPTWPVWPRETSRWPATVWRSHPRFQTAAPPRSSSARQGSPWRTMAWWQVRCDHQRTWERPTTDDDDDTVPLPEEDLVKQNLFCNFLSRWRWSHLSLISMMTGILTSLGSPLISVAKSRHPHCDYRWPGRSIFILSLKTNSYYPHYPHYPNFVCAKNKIITIAVQASWLIGKSDNVESNRFSDSPANQQSCSNFSSVFLLSHNVNFCTVQKKGEISVDPVDILLFCEFLNNVIRVIVLTQVSVLLLLHYWLVVQPCCCWKTNLKILWNCFLGNSKDKHYCTESWQVQRRQVV